MSRTFMHLLVLRLFIPTLALMLIGMLSLGFLWYKSVGTEQQQLANSVAHAVSRYLEQGHRVLATLVLVAGEVGQDAFLPYLQSSWWSFGFFDTLYLLDNNKHIVFMAPFDERYSGLDLSGQPFISLESQKKKGNVSKPFTSLRTGDPTVLMAQQLDSGGLVAGELNLKELQVVIDAAFHRGSRDMLFVVDGSGLLLAHPKKELVSQQVNVGHLKIVQAGLAGKHEPLFHDEDGLFIGASAPIQGTDWLVVVQAKVEDVNKPVLKSIAPVLFLLLCIWIALLWTFRRRLQAQVLRPVELLGQAAVSLSSGNLDHRIDIRGKNEIGAVAGAFNVMANRLKRRVGMENLISDISRRFVNASGERVNRAIVKTLRDCGMFAEADRCYLFLFAEDGATLSNTHEWCRNGVTPQIDSLQNIPYDAFPWFLGQLRQHGVLQMMDVQHMPPEAVVEQQALQEQDIVSLLCVAIGRGESLRGFMGFDVVTGSKVWSRLDIDILRVVGELISNVLERDKVEQALERELDLNTALSQLSEALLSTLSLEGMARLVLRKAMQLTQSPIGLVSIVDSGNGVQRFYQEALSPELGCGRDSMELEAHVDSGVFEWVMGRKKSFLTNNLPEDPRGKGMPEDHPRIISLAAVPSLVEDTLIGQIVVANNPAGYGDPARQALERLAVLFAIAMRRGMAEEEVAALNRQLEQKVLDRTKELLQKTEDLEQANVKLTELDRMKSSFLSSVSHELRTPLTSVQGFARLITRDFSRLFQEEKMQGGKCAEKGQRILQNLKVIESESMRLTSLINDVLDISKIEAGSMSWNDTLLHVEDVLRQAVASVNNLFSGKRHLLLEVDIASNLPLVFMDRDRLLQVCLNLLDNAVKFTAEGSVRLKAVKLTGDFVRIEITDTGAGIPENELENIFDKFHQIQKDDTLKDKPKGTGLGLAICRQIVEHYGGKIGVTSTVGLGSTFYVELVGMQSGHDDANGGLPTRDDAGIA